MAVIVPKYQTVKACWGSEDKAPHNQRRCGRINSSPLNEMVWAPEQVWTQLHRGRPAHLASLLTRWTILRDLRLSRRWGWRSFWFWRSAAIGTRRLKMETVRFSETVASTYESHSVKTQKNIMNYPGSFSMPVPASISSSQKCNSLPPTLRP
jgi:hypothetical protein